MKIFRWTVLLACFGFGILQAQTTAELEQIKEEKQNELSLLEGQSKELKGRVSTLQREIAELTDKLTPYPRWDLGAAGNTGLSFSSYTDWLSKSNPNTTAINIGFSGNGFANLQQQKYFWRNRATLTLGWIKFDDRDDESDSNKFKTASDALSISSLLGYKLSEKFAISTLGEYRTSVLDKKLNNPGYLDVGLGATGTPIKNMVVVLHPLNYNFIFSSNGFDYESTLGTKIVVDYMRQLTPGIAWKSNVSAFMSYQSSDQSNWTWVNGFTTAVKGIGIGLDVGLRANKQEALARELTNNPLQSYWILGLTFAL